MENIRRTVMLFLSAVLLFGLVSMGAQDVHGLEYEYYNDYNHLVNIYNQGNCGSMQGFTGYGDYLYCAKINGNTEQETVITRTHKNTGDTVLMTNAANGSTRFTYLSHSNDLEVADINGTTAMFVATGAEGSNSLVRFTMSGTSLTYFGEYRALYNNAEIYVAGVQVLRCDGENIDLLVKKGKYYYYATVGVNQTSGDMHLTPAFTLDTYHVTINGVTKDLSNFLGQGFDYYDGRIYVPLTGNDQTDISAIAVYNINGAHGTIINDPTLSFWIKSTTYAALFEIEGVYICPTDGNLYFNTNRRLSSSDANHDGIHYIAGYTHNPARGTTGPANYRWEVIDDVLTPVTAGGMVYNAVNVHGGSIDGGEFSNSTFNLDKSILLNHDEPWVVEWKSTGNWGESALLFAESPVSKTEGASYLFRRKNSTLIALGRYEDGTFYNYGVQIGEHGVDSTKPHVYSLRNRINDDGSNMIYLYVDGLELGPMNQYHIAGTAQGTTSNWLSGKDFAFNYMGTDAHPIDGCSIEYIQVWGNGMAWAKDEPNIFRWETSNDTFTAIEAVGYTANQADMIAGSIDGGVMTDVHMQLEESIVLLHDRPWSVEWQSEGSWTGGAMLFGTSYNSRSLNAPFLYRRPESQLIGFGYYDGTQYNNYGLTLSDYGVDGSASHVYRLTNRVEADGSNMVYLFVDGVELGAMNNYYIGGTSQKTTDNWVSGKDFTFSYFATSQFAIYDCSIDYVQVWENGIPGQAVPQNYLWEPKNDVLTSVADETYVENLADPMAGSITDGSFSGSYFRLEEPVVLNHDRPWVVEWQSEGSWKDIASGAMLLSASNHNNELNAPYLYRRNDSQIIAFGAHYDGKHRNYGISLANHGIDGTAPHVYRLENRVNTDGTNMVYLFVDDAELGAMNNYFVAGTSQNVTDNWISGKDFVFPYMGTKAFPIGNCALGYLRVYENGEPSYTVEFRDWDGTVLTSHSYHIGDPVQIPGDPVRADDDAYRYTFAGWDPAVTICQGDAVYTATYTADPIGPTITGKGFSLSVESEILVNFYYEISDLSNVTEQGMLVFYNDPGNADIAEADEVYPGSAGNNGIFLNTTKGIAAKYMGDDRCYAAYSILSDGRIVYSKLYTYSPKTYAMNMLGRDTTSQNQKALCVAMLNYGAAAQEYFGYKTDDLMNAVLTAEQQAMVVSYSPDLFAGAIPADSSKVGNFARTETGFSSRSATLSLDGAFAINYYFAPSEAVDDTLTLYYWSADDYANAATLKTTNATGSVTMKQVPDGSYWAQVEGIAAKQLDDTYYVAGVYTSNTQVRSTGVIAYSLSKYCMGKATGTDALAKLAAATAVYGYHAKVYFS